MENILPFLVAGALFIYQIYANYQKEQEKARQRNPSQRPPADLSDEPYQPVDEPVVDWEFTEPAEVILDRPIIQDSQQPKKTREENKYERWNTTDVPEEVLRMRQYRAAKKEKELLTTEPLQVEIVEEDADVAHGGFDLREAVIQSAVLERPYA